MKSTTFPNPTSATGELIKRYRLQMLVHSCLYYDMDVTVIEDAEFDRRAKVLAVLLEQYPGEYSDRFDQYFEEWDGSSGFDLPHRDPWVRETAEMIKRLCE